MKVFRFSGDYANQQMFEKKNVNYAEDGVSGDNVSRCDDGGNKESNIAAEPQEPTEKAKPDKRKKGK